jgi:hypothetical protein
MATSKVAPPQHSSDSSRRDLLHVVAAQAGREQGLVRVAPGRVGDQHALLVQHPARETRGAQLPETLPAARRRVAGRYLWQAGRRERPRRGPSDHLGVAVDDDFAQEAEQAGRPVAPRRKVEERRRLVDEARRVVRPHEPGMLDQRLEEPQIGRHPADAELAQRPVHARDGSAPRR